MIPIFALLFATAACADVPVQKTDENSAGQSADRNLAEKRLFQKPESVDPEKLFQAHSWVLPIEMPVNKNDVCSWSTKHSTLHFNCSPHTAVRSIAKGKVLFTGWYGDYGKVVIIDHEEGFASLYAHLGTALVSKDDEVLQGQTIGKTGSTRYGRGKDVLHFEVRKDGKPFDFEKTAK